jgi:hypothetical protein
MRRVPGCEKGIDIFPIDIVRGDEAPPIFAECDPQRLVIILFHRCDLTLKTNPMIGSFI